MQRGTKTFACTHAQTACHGVHIHWQEWEAVGQELAMANDTKIELELAHLPNLATLALAKGYLFLLFLLFPVYACRSASARLPDVFERQACLCVSRTSNALLLCRSERG